MISTRRKFMTNAALSPLYIGAAASILPKLSEEVLASTLPATAPGVGCITGLDPTQFAVFEQWLGARPTFNSVAFNQTSPINLSNSIWYGCSIGAALTKLGATVEWSVPCPGPHQLEAIVAGTHDAIYKNLFNSILAVYNNNGQPIYIRLPWEFNFSFQENAATDKNGRWNGALFIAAWQHLSKIARTVSTRFVRIWCPAVNTQQFDPALCWPGANYVDIVSQDFYMQKAYDKAGGITGYMNQQRGLIWAKNFAAANGKPFALSEWGMDNDIFINDFNVMALWMQGLGNQLHHHCWWNRPEVINCMLTDGSHPKLAAAYKSKFA